MLRRWFSDAGIRSGALSFLGVDITLLGMAFLAFDAAVSVILIPAGVVMTVIGLPAGPARSLPMPSAGPQAGHGSSGR